MIEKGAAIDASSVELKGLDVEKSSVPQMAETLQGADGLIIAVGFVPGNPFKMNAAAHAVDNVGTIALVDAAKAAGVKKVGAPWPACRVTSSLTGPHCTSPKP